MTASKRRPPTDGGAHANYRLLPKPSIEAAMDSWRWLHAHGLGSELVWNTLFGPFGLPCGGGR